MEIAKIQSIPMIVNILKILSVGFLAFVMAFLITPLLTHFLYQKKLGIKIKKNSVDGQKLTYINQLHGHKSGTPTMGGVLIWLTVLILILASHYLFPLIAKWLNINFIARLDFFSRSQTWLPLFALVSVSPPPFLVLDEVDAALDDRNSKRFAEMLKEFSKTTQFIVVTHNRTTMEVAHVLYGVTLNDDGTSKILSMKFEG